MAYDDTYMNSLIRIRLGILVLLLAATLMVWHGSARGSMSTELTISFLDVGQGDAILIETPDGIDVLVDGGPGSAVLAELAATLGAFDRTIDMVVATHPDADHIGGLIDVLARYDVHTILMTEHEGDSNAARAYREAVRKEGAEIVYAAQGQQFLLGASTTLDILFPVGDATGMGTNESSIVARLAYGETDVLLTGDAPRQTEMELVAMYGEGLESEILKVGHHGSRTSTDGVFVETVAPTYAVISAGEDNQYGHPHQEVLTTLAAHGVSILETANERITFATDGVNLRLE